MPFPFSNLGGVKRRPVLVLSSTPFNAAQEDVIVCQITSNIALDGYSVPLMPEDLVAGMLKAPSRIKPYRITALDQKLLGKQIGKISEEKFIETLKMLNRVME